MARSNDQLPLRGLAVFEAAGRLGSFTAAAEALGLTQTAVSQHVARLEAELGGALFVRGRRGVALTAMGGALHTSVERGFAVLADGVAAARRRGGRGSIELLTDPGFAFAWLMPRMGEIAALLPGVEVRLATTSVDLRATDAAFDLALMFGDGRWPGYRTQWLYAETVFPVAAPALAGAEIADLPLIHLRGPAAQRCLDWADWFAASGIDRAADGRDLHVDNYQLALEAAMAGRGACLGWTPLVDAALTDRRLVRLAPGELAGPHAYYLVEPLEAPPRASLQTLRAWLLAGAECLPAENRGDHDVRVPQPA